MPAYTKVQHQGRTLDKATLAALRQVEMVLGYGQDTLTVLQGSYNAGRVEQSAGTHDGAGAADLTAQNRDAKVRAMRFVGFGAWFRQRLVRRGRLVWNDHVHGILWCAKTWSRTPQAAQQQVYDARHDLTGLAGHYKDQTGAPTLKNAFHYDGRRPVSLARMKALRSSGKAALPGSVAHRQVARVRVALKREGIAITTGARKWPAREWEAFERRVLKRSSTNTIPDARGLIELGRRHKTFMAQH